MHLLVSYENTTTLNWQKTLRESTMKSWTMYVRYSLFFHFPHTHRKIFLKLYQKIQSDLSDYIHL